MQKNSAVTAQGTDQIDGGAHQTSPAELYPPANDMDNSKIAAEANQSGQDWSNNQAAPSQRPAGYPVLTHPNQHGHQAPFDMGPLNDLLPTINHRQRQQSIHYVNSPPPSYVPTSPNAGPYMQHMPSFSNQSVQMPNQPFYVQQPHLPQYYLPAQMHQTPRQSFVQTQQSMVYYPNQVVANHAQQGFFYSQDGQFAGHSSGAPPNVLTNAYLAGSSKAGQRTHQPGISRQVRGQRALQGEVLQLLERFVTWR